MAERVRVRPVSWLAEARIARVDEVFVQRGHVLLIDLARQTERLGAGAVPAAGRLAGSDGAGVIVLAASGDRTSEVVG